MLPNNCSTDQHLRENGFSLIEVLVTIAITSFGLLGVAGLLMSAINAGQVSMNRSVAVELANDMADNIRSNWQALNGGSFDAVPAGASVASGCSTQCMTGQCSPSDQANLQICLWRAQLNKRLPGGQGSIVVDTKNPKCVDQSLPCLVTVTVTWNESNYSSANSASQLLSTSANNYALQVQP